MMIREPAVAGMFYSDDADECQRLLEGCFAGRVALPELAGRVIGGVVPHAGWACSGKVAAAVFDAVARGDSPEVFVIFGANHRPQGRKAALFASGRWDLPNGSMAIDERLADRVLGHTNLIEDDAYAHEPEHSIEVEVPFLLARFPGAKLLPIMVPPVAEAVEIGEAVGRTLEAYKCKAAVLASSDLTHYGPRYGFAPRGVCDAGLAWAKDVNDARVLERIVALDADAIVGETQAHRNACGGGAIAAAIAASRRLGAARGVVLDHTTSRETVGGPEAGGNAVGYAGVVFLGS